MSAEDILSALQAIIDGAKDDDGAERSLTDEEVDRYEKLEADLKAVQRSEAIVKRQAAYGTVVTPRVAVGARNEGDEVSRAFDAYMRTGRVESDLIVRAQGEASPAAGGYLVPEGFRQKMVERRKAFGGIANNSETISTDSGNPLPWPINDDVSNVAAIVAEGGNVSAGGADLVFGTRSLGAYKYGSGGASNLPLKVSYELLQDSAFDIQSYVAKRLGERIARAQAPHWATGTGVNEPQGLLSTGGGIAGATAWSSNSAPTYADLVTIVHDLDPDYREGAVWVFNDGVLEVLRKIVDGDGRSILWDHAMNLENGMGGMTLLGHRVVIDQACPAPSASNKFGFFGRLEEAYVIRRVKAFSMATLTELYANDGQIGYLAWERADGAVQDPYAGVLLTAAA